MSESKSSKYHSNNKFFILHEFNNELRDGIIIPLTEKIEELSKQKEAEIEIHINSHGGSAELCMHIIRLMELAKSREIIVRTLVMEVANSAGSFVAVAGTKGERYIARGAEQCVHYGSTSGWRESTPLQTERNSEYKKRWFAKTIAHYQKYCKIPNLQENIKDDSFFITSEDCIKWKMADKYLEEMK